MCIDKSQYKIQRPQSAHRLKLIDFWDIPQGSKVLEIGCGQGDTTAALAFAVGKGGFVHAVDTASPDYGAPETLGEARARLLSSPLGGRLQINLETNMLSPDAPINDSYDFVVLSHCSWYFASKQALRQLLCKTSKIAARLCFAEWDIRVQHPNQIPHFLAACIQAQCACYQAGDGNIQTLFFPAELMEIATESGWAVQRQTSFCSPKLQDGAWEVAATKSVYPQIIQSSTALPKKMKELLLSQINAMESFHSHIMPLNVFAFVANPL